jgi:hypothetical protein
MRWSVPRPVRQAAQRLGFPKCGCYSKFRDCSLKSEAGMAAKRESQEDWPQKCSKGTKNERESLSVIGSLDGIQDRPLLCVKTHSCPSRFSFCALCAFLRPILFLLSSGHSCCTPQCEFTSSRHSFLAAAGFFSPFSENPKLAIPSIAFKFVLSRNRSSLPPSTDSASVENNLS